MVTNRESFIRRQLRLTRSRLHITSTNSNNKTSNNLITPTPPTKRSHTSEQHSVAAMLVMMPFADTTNKRQQHQQQQHRTSSKCSYLVRKMSILNRHATTAATPSPSSSSTSPTSAATMSSMQSTSSAFAWRAYATLQRLPRSTTTTTNDNSSSSICTSGSHNSTCHNNNNKHSASDGSNNNRSSNATNTNGHNGNGNNRNSFVAPHLSIQIRAVSSPSLCDVVAPESLNGTLHKKQQQQQPNGRATALEHVTTTTVNGSGSSGGITTTLPTSQSVGVLQKFKRTLTQFNKAPTSQQQHAASNVNGGVCVEVIAAATPTEVNGTSSTATTTTTAPLTSTELGSDSVDTASGKYRFGPLKWRTSKDRRNAKHNRRDKCNSGDSGIQIELENDEQFARFIAAAANANGVGGGSGIMAANSGTCDAAKQMETSRLRELRRTNSAKAAAGVSVCVAATASAKSKALMRKFEMTTEREAPESLPTRSLSQPNGLDVCGIGLRAAELEESDSDSVTSHDEVPNFLPLYAEVLYNFTAAGPQELGLERGTLIEILRKEVGLWWFGRIKKEEASLVEEILEPELGWFPKEFVRVIQCPEKDAFYLRCTQASLAPPTFAAVNPLAGPQPKSLLTGSGISKTLVSASGSGSGSGGGNSSNETTLVDQNNVTTIVIDSPSTPSATTSTTMASSSVDVVSAVAAAAAVEANSVGGPLVLSRSINVIMDTSDILRRSAVKELLDTEVNYVNLLSSICEGYLPAMNKRIDIFSPGSVRLIFSNISAIYKFQRKFLDALRKGIEQNQVAKVFLKMHKEFLCYSTYCNEYPRALLELESYERLKDAKTILDNCRESENLTELPLSAHLLAPVQRICRYPLHLSEILKTAKSVELNVHELQQQLQQERDIGQLDVCDTKETINMALDAMKSITEAVNEGKRHSETIARHQASFQNFKGPPLHLHSTRFFLQIDATRQKQNLWNSSYTLFLFDNQLVYCKRDIIKRSQFIYKGRILLDGCRVLNVRDGKMFGHTIKNSLRLYCEAREKWYDFSFRSANRKHRFLSTLALERQFGGKSLYVSEMTGFEYPFDERDYSDQSDYELPDIESVNGSGECVTASWLREYRYDGTTTTGTGTSGESSLPDSPAKSSSSSYKYCDTLPKKSQSRDNSSDSQTSSLGRRRLGKWFRKPKSTNSTPNHSPTHKPATMFLSANDLQLSQQGGGSSIDVSAKEESISVSSNSKQPSTPAPLSGNNTAPLAVAEAVVGTSSSVAATTTTNDMAYNA